jgi:hypothetical protein
VRNIKRTKAKHPPDDKAPAALPSAAKALTDERIGRDKWIT